MGYGSTTIREGMVRMKVSELILYLLEVVEDSGDVEVMFPIVVEHLGVKFTNVPITFMASISNAHDRIRAVEPEDWNGLVEGRVLGRSPILLMSGDNENDSIDVPDCFRGKASDGHGYVQ